MKTTNQKRVLSKEERPNLEDVFIKVWALLESYHYIMEETTCIQGGIKSGLLLLSIEVRKELELAVYGELLWEDMEEKERNFNCRCNCHK